MWRQLCIVFLLFGISINFAISFQSARRIFNSKTKLIPSFMSFSNQYNFLYPSTAKSSDNGDIYYNQILRQSIAACKSALSKTPNQRLEISFPEALKSDISAAESMDQTQLFGLQFANTFSQQIMSSNDGLWVVFPDKKEVKIAVDRLKSQNQNVKLSFNLTSIDVVVKTLLDPNNLSNAKSLPSALIVLYPGFNVEEYILLAELEKYMNPITIIVVNGQLERLRNGYYPALFYPKLAQANKRFFQSFVSTYNLNPIALNGDRYAAWLVRNYPNAWQLLVKNPALTTDGNKYVVSEEFTEEPKAQDVWKLAKSRIR